MISVFNKFEIGQEVFVIEKENMVLEEIQTCPVCLGSGNIVHRGYKMSCPKCNGKKEIVLNAKRVSLFSVDNKPHNITSIKYTISKEGEYLRYRINNKSISEDMIFATREEAEMECERLNNPETMF